MRLITLCTHESKCTRCARFRWLILNVSPCQTTILRVQHPSRDSVYLLKQRCIALGHRNKMSDFNDRADEIHNPYATNAGGSKKKKKKDAVKRWFAWQRSSLALPACSLPHIPLFTRCSALWWRRQTHKYSTLCEGMKGWNMIDDEDSCWITF